MSKPTRSTPATRDTTRDSGQAQPLLARILDTPHLARLVPHLPPDALHRLITHCGLEDSVELVAMASPAQLNGVLDIDLWRSSRPGHDEQLDPERFGTWLEVLIETGADNAARTLAQLDPAVVTAGFAAHIRVLDLAAASAVEIGGEPIEIRGADEETSCQIGGCLIVARRTDAWDAIVAALIALDAAETDRFREVMRGCRRLSNAGRELDGLDNLMADPEQSAFDLADARRLRRERQGYVTAADARAFLELARQPHTAAGPRTSPVAAAYFRAVSDLEPGSVADRDEAVGNGEATQPDTSHEAPATAAALINLLAEAGVMPAPPRALLEGAHAPTSDTPLLRAQLHAALERSEDAFGRRSQELAFLANTLIAGCSIQGRPFTHDEASRAARAVCNLGLERWKLRPDADAPAPTLARPNAMLPADFLVEHDLVSVFEVGWRVLYVDVCLHVAGALVAVLDSLSCSDRDIQVGLRLLRRQMAQQLAAGTPWRVREALDVIMLLDLPAWAGLVGLVAEYPVLHDAAAPSGGRPARTIDPAAFAFIADSARIGRVHAFMRSLPEMLRG